ncbi:DUF5675 family protein [Flagellimonas sp. C4]|uniref:DUF5675 family protein n=1 Tax=Flagellimonas alginolytica TaxID=3177515 RepID=UPI0035C8CF52
MKLKVILTVILLGSLLCARAQVTPAEKQALQDLYNATNGPNWATETDGFIGDEWNFDGVVTNDWYGVTVANGHVTELDLEFNELSGIIPASIGNLVHLTRLNLSTNALMGNIPNEIGNIVTLQILDLFNNQLSGNIPQELGDLTDLTSLYIFQNNLSGEIPVEFGNLFSLTSLHLNSNNLSGAIPPELGNLSNLSFLRLNSNELTGAIPPELGNLSNLLSVSLQNNLLSGTIPAELENCSNLEELYLQNNNLSGVIPQEVFGLNFLTAFNIQNNKFDFGHMEFFFQNWFEYILNHAPQQKTDQPEALQINEGDNISLTTAISGTQNHYQWYKDGQPINGAPDAPDYDINNATVQDAGTYHCVMTSDIVNGLVLTRHNIELIVANNPEEPEQPEEENWNIITVWDYDLDTKLKANTRRYYDDLGKHVQTQSWDLATNTIWGQATLYDFQGRAALSSLSAPIPGQSEFQYHPSLITKAGGEAYTAPDFDTDPFSPESVTADGPVGQYYTGITSDQYQDVTAYPFSRTIFSDLNPGKPLAVVGGNKTDTDQDGNLTDQDTWPQAYSFTMPATDELSLNVAFNDVAYKNIQTLKTVTRDVHGNETVIFTDTDGKLLATARSGEQGKLSQPMDLFIGPQGYVDVHIPKGVNTGISVSDENAVTLYNLITDALEPNPANNLKPGFYRVAVNDIVNYVPNTISVSYVVNYYDYGLNDYDEAGRLITSYQPVEDQNGNKLATHYRYNTLGQLIAVSSPDEGSSRFSYRKDGQIRYSQNSKQATNNEVSYTDYDNFGRPVQSGVLINVDFFNLDPDDFLPQVPQKEVTTITYDFLDNNDLDFLADLDSDYKHPSFLPGNVAKTANEQSTTYYSYDGYGRVTWVVQHIEGLGSKTIDYAYEPSTGLVHKVMYQKGRDDQFVHRYTYNARDQLVQVETSVDDNNFTLNAEYLYNDAGTLVRTELANGAQGLDYVYNLVGQLKSINHPSLATTNDPGGDANDLFGMQLDYHLGDYQRTENSNISTAPQGTDQWNGNIKGIRWQTDTNGQESQYVYSYDRNNWLTAADFAPGANNNGAYDVSGITYDANGNIQSLIRKKDPDNQNNTAMDHLTYNYDLKKPNRLLWVDDAEGDVPDADDLGDQEKGNYQYNSIGQLTKDVSGGISYIYTASGLVAEVLKNGEPLVKFFYNDRNHRVRKEIYGNGNLIYTIYYVRDVAGQTMAVYNDVGGDPALEEQPIYGAGRIGIAYNGNNNEKTYVYELTDHLGNVRAVFTKAENDANLEGYTDYYPGGMAMPNRNLEDANGYRYGYQGQFAEEDEETGLNAFELRLYDPRINRWLSPDPYGQFDSPYLAMGNNWANMTDPDGGYCPDCPNEGDTITQGYMPGDTYNSSDGNTYMLLDGDFGWASTPEIVVLPRNTLTITRDVQTENSTTSTFYLDSGFILSSLNVSGFFLEPAGPDTTVPNQDLRIPEGTYNLRSHNGRRFQNVYNLYNDDVPQSRAILIHAGNIPRNTEGCLLPGSTRGTDRVGMSRPKLNELRLAIDEIGVENILIKIHNKFHSPVFPSQNPSDYN